MNKLAIAVISTLTLGTASARAMVVDQTYNFYITGDFANGPSQDLPISLDQSLGRVVSLTYRFAAVEEWYAPIITTGPLQRNPTVRMAFEGDVVDDTDNPPEGLASITTRLADVTSLSPYALNMRGWLTGSFRDDPSLYTNLLPDGSYGRTLTVFPNIDWDGNQVCSGPCNWYLDVSQDQGISLIGTLTQSVNYAPFFVPEPPSLALLAFGAVATGFAAARRNATR